MSEPNQKRQVKELGISDILELIERQRSIKQIDSNQVQIILGRNRVYTKDPERPPFRNRLTEERLAEIRKALQEPSKFRGSIRIYLGSSNDPKNKIFHVKQGQLVLDSLNLSQQATARTSQAEAPEAVSQPRTPPTSERPLTEVERLTARVEALETLVERQSKQLEALERQVMAAKRRSPVITPDRSFQRWLTQLEEVGNRFLNQLLERFQSMMRETRSEMQTLVGGLHQLTIAKQQTVARLPHRTQLQKENCAARTSVEMAGNGGSWERLHPPIAMHMPPSSSLWRSPCLGAATRPNEPPVTAEKSAAVPPAAQRWTLRPASMTHSEVLFGGAER